MASAPPPHISSVPVPPRPPPFACSTTPLSSLPKRAWLAASTLSLGVPFPLPTTHHRGASLLLDGHCSTMNRDHLGEEGSTGRPSRSCVTRYGTRGPGSQADRNAKTDRHGLLAGDDGASHRRRPSSLKGGNRCAGTGATSWPGPALPNAYDADNSLQCMTLPNLD